MAAGTAASSAEVVLASEMAPAIATYECPPASTVEVTATPGMPKRRRVVPMAHQRGQQPKHRPQLLPRCMYCRCVGGSVSPWPNATVLDSVALCGGMTLWSAPM